MLQLKKVDRVVPDPRCGLRESDGGLNVLFVTRSARAQFREAIRIACQGRPATTDVDTRPMGEAKMKSPFMEFSEPFFRFGFKGPLLILVDHGYTSCV